ncbi:MarR family winged helix-turn-helix transcriptional regulator [Motilibacter aurantiacus]|uniref:MarR family winged helix-turn-helix transcriptional regulator n=1 Tax=Motilibacter aurantiacus TaxID=2714955 RepID=UPI002F2B5138
MPDPLALEEDVVLLIAACHSGLSGRVAAQLDSAGFRALRQSHGYLVQHLIDGPKTIGQLAELLGMSQQGASKSVAELEDLGYVERHRGEDARVRRVELTEHGWAAVESARAARKDLRRALRRRLGVEGYEQLNALLVEVATWSGGMDALVSRTLRQDA